MPDTVLFSQSIGPLTRTDIVRYAGAGGDFNPLHHDEIFAKKAGFTSVIAHGLLTAGLAGSALSEQVGPLRLRRYSVRYTGQVRPGDTLQVTATENAPNVDEDSSRRRISIEVTATGEDAAPRPVLSAVAEADR